MKDERLGQSNKNRFFSDIASGLALCALLLLTSCATLPNVEVQNIQDRQVAYAAKGKGIPVIVLESGLGVSMSTWSPIFERLSETTRVFAYDRLRLGRSTQTQTPETAWEVAEQLHQNLISTGHAPPYLLVGHSAGGLYVNVFARMYPEEVMGVVLVDSTHPSQFENSRTEQPITYLTLLAASVIGKMADDASIIKNVHNEFKNIEPFPDIPLVVLTADKFLLETTQRRERWLELQEDLASMSTDLTHKVVAGSGHFIHKDNPQIVIEEITRLINASNQLQ